MSSMCETERTGTFYGVGIGPGDPGLLTLRAVEVLRAADVICHVAGPRTKQSVSGLVVDSVEGCAGRRMELVFSMAAKLDDREAAWSEGADRVSAELEAGLNVAFVTLGDPLIYSTFGYLRRKVLARFPELRIEVVPGITSFQAAAAVEGRPLVEDRDVLAVIPSWDGEAPPVDSLNGADTAVMLKTYKYRNRTLDALREACCFEDILYASRVGLADQLTETDPDRVSALPLQYLSMLIARRKRHD